MDPETISDLSYITELTYPPRILNKTSLRRIYAELGDTLDLTEVKKLPDGIQFTTHLSEEREVGKYIIRKNSILIANEFVSIGGLECFWKKAETLTKKVTETLKIPIFLMQGCVIRILATPSRTDDSRVFIGNMVCGLKPENLHFFNRPAQVIGLRFFFPPKPNVPYEFDLKVESRISDISKIWLENKARFFAPISKNKLSIIHDNLCTTRKFLVENVAQFLNQYNQPMEDVQ